VQVLFNMFSYAARPLALPGIGARPVPVPASGSPFDLTVYGEHRDGRLRVEIVYNPDLFSADRMASMLDRVCAVLAEGVARPDRPLRDLGVGPGVPYGGPVLRPAGAGRRSAGEPPATATERAVAAVWSAVTGTAAVGVTDNFFEVGGSSMTAVAVQQRLNAGLGTALSVVDIFRYPTVRALAARIDGPTVDRTSTDDGLDRAAHRGAARRERAAARQRRGRTGRTP
jgi:mycobactin peptide synthetase MbtE